MQRFEGQLIRRIDDNVTGNAASGVQVTVFDRNNASQVVVYPSDVIGAQLTQPISTDANGRFFFYAPNGKYWIRTNDGTADFQVQLFDIDDFQALLDNRLPTSGGVIVGNLTITGTINVGGVAQFDSLVRAEDVEITG